jgi:hypothetical protein
VSTHGCLTGFDASVNPSKTSVGVSPFLSFDGDTSSAFIPTAPEVWHHLFICDDYAHKRLHISLKIVLLHISYCQSLEF